MFRGLFSFMLRAVGLRPWDATAEPLRVSSAKDARQIAHHFGRRLRWRHALYPACVMAAMGAAIVGTIVSDTRPSAHMLLDVGALAQFGAAVLYFSTDHIDHYDGCDDTRCPLTPDHLAAACCVVVVLLHVTAEARSLDAWALLAVVCRTHGLYAMLLTVGCATMVLVEHVKMLRVYTLVLEDAPWTAQAAGLAALLRHLLYIRESLEVSARVLYTVYSVFVATGAAIVGTALFSIEQGDVDALWGMRAPLALAVVMLGTFFVPVYQLSKEKEDIGDVVKSGSFADAVLLHGDGLDPRTAIEWLSIMRVLDDTWFEIRVLGIPLHSGSMVQQIIIAVGVALTYAQTVRVEGGGE